MDKTTFIIELLKIITWPATIIILLISLKSLAKRIPNDLIQNILNRKHLKAKLGNAEFELGEINRQLRETINIVAKENDPQKRLELAKRVLSVETAISELTDEDIKLLKKYKAQAHCFLLIFMITPLKMEN